MVHLVQACMPLHSLHPGRVRLAHLQPGGGCVYMLTKIASDALTDLMTSPYALVSLIPFGGQGTSICLALQPCQQPGHGLCQRLVDRARRP